VALSIDTDDTTVRFLVEDTGIGIAPEDRSLIFEPFRQGEGAPNRRFSGTGLGLSIARDLARKLEGDVTVESEIGKGSKFTLTLPRVLAVVESVSQLDLGVPLYPVVEAEAARVLSLSNELLEGVRNSDGTDGAFDASNRALSALPLSVRPASVPPSQRADHELFAGRTILLVDDDVRNVFALTRVLEALGIRVVVARNGVDAIAIAERRNDLALILMDVMMPEMDGLEATRRIRKLDARVSAVPIIALTANVIANDREACLRAGATEYITKPVDTERLVALLRIWIQGAG
jgi:CheY-like chemotaxis protein